MNFQNVNANNITDRMTIRIANVNGIDAEIAARNGVLQIRAVKKNDFDRNYRYKFEKGVIRGFVNNAAREAEIIVTRPYILLEKRTSELIIPNNIWGDPVISIGEEAFLGNNLDYVTIPNSVRIIGRYAFVKDKRSNVSSITRFTIGANVDTTDRSSFFSYYNGKGAKKAGTYTYHTFPIDFWSYSP